LYDPAQRKIIVSRDVIFDETRGWDWDNKEKQKDSSIIVNEESDGELADAAQVNENAGENAGDEDTEFVDPTNENNSTDAEDQDDVSEDTDDDQPRARRVPGHLRDYVIGREAEEDQELHNYAVYCNDDDPISYDDASKTNVWRKAMDLEIESIEKNNTWELTTLPEGVKAIGVKWVYKTKYNENGEVDKHKARLVAKGYSQKYGIDYHEVFAPVARWDTIRTVIALAASKGFSVYQLDVKSAFLHGDLTEDIHVEQPLGYQKGGNNMVYKLKKALYGLRQAPRAWYSKIESYFSL
jgi:hypothetical protein